MRGQEGLRIELVKGSGERAEGERAVPTLNRESAVARALGRLSKRDPFQFEHLAFAFSLQPLIARRRPDLVYFSEWHTGRGLALLRRLTHGSFRTLLSNGTMATAGFDHLDHVQQLTPAALATVLEQGADPERQTMLPLGAPIGPRFAPLSRDERDGLRGRLDLPTDRPVLLSVAALNRYHKRIHYLVEEVARLPELQRPFLVMAGQVEAETPGIRRLALERLGDAGHSIRTVPHSEVADLYRASDAHVLTSLGEALGRVMIEAMAHGVPCYAHDYAVTRFVLGEHGHLADFTRPGGLAELLADRPVDDARHEPGAVARHAFAYENFSWDALRPRYLEMMRRAATGPLYSGRRPRANRTVSSSSGEDVSR